VLPSRLPTTSRILDRQRHPRVLDLDSYIYGFALQEASLPFGTVENATVLTGVGRAGCG
jgi:hypothetical protein